MQDSNEIIQLSDVHNLEDDESPLDVLVDTMSAIDGKTFFIDNY